MKRFVVLVLAVLMIAVLAGCKDYSKHQFDYLGEDFSWDMTVEDAVTYIEARQGQVKLGAKVSSYESHTTVSDRDYVFRFDETGKIEFVKCDMNGNRDRLRQIVELYGEYDEYDESYNAYRWYGTMAGRETQMSFTTTMNLDVWLEFEPA